MLTIIKVMEIVGDKYRIDEVINESGSFSIVYKGTDLTIDKKIAIKKVNVKTKNDMSGSKKKMALDKINREIDIMKKLDHINIVKYEDTIKVNNTWYIIMEYCDAGTFTNLIRYQQNAATDKFFNRELNTFYYMNQLHNALLFLREHNLIHRDIKPNNILLHRSNNSDKIDYHHRSGLIVKLADFGMAKIYTKEDNPLEHTYCGTPMYMSPEMATGRLYSPNIDLWSFGVILYEMMYGENPFKTNSYEGLKKKLNSEINFHLNDLRYTSDFTDLLTRLLNKNQEQRISWDKFESHRWFMIWNKQQESHLKSTIYSKSLPINCDNNTFEMVEIFKEDNENLEVFSNSKPIPIPQLKETSERMHSRSEPLDYPNIRTVRRNSGISLFQSPRNRRCSSTEIDSIDKSSENERQRSDSISYGYQLNKSGSSPSNSFRYYARPKLSINSLANSPSSTKLDYGSEVELNSASSEQIKGSISNEIDNSIQKKIELFNSSELSFPLESYSDIHDLEKEIREQEPPLILDEPEINETVYNMTCSQDNSVIKSEKNESYMSYLSNYFSSPLKYFYK